MCRAKLLVADFISGLPVVIMNLSFLRFAQFFRKVVELICIYRGREEITKLNI